MFKNISFVCHRFSLTRSKCLLPVLLDTLADEHWIILVPSFSCCGIKFMQFDVVINVDCRSWGLHTIRALSRYILISVNPAADNVLTAIIILGIKSAKLHFRSTVEYRKLLTMHRIDMAGPTSIIKQWQLLLQ